jgi:hypothetical protein
MSPASIGHDSGSLSTNDNKVGGRKGKFKFPCNLCNGNHHTYHFPRRKEASQVLEDSLISHRQPSVASQESSPTQPLVDQVVNTIQYLVEPTLPLESVLNTTNVFFVTSDSFGQGRISLVSMEPHPSTEVIFFDLNGLKEPCIPSYMHFRIIV